jgi:hypothetical protein
MRLRGVWRVLLGLAMLATAGCATRFSPQWTRQEIARQTGVEPQDSFEFKLEGATMKFAKVAASRISGEPVNFGWLSLIHLAIFDLPAGRRVSFDDMRFTGWDKPLQTQEGSFGLLVLVRTQGDALADLVVFAQGENQLLYGRQKGRLDPELPSTIQRVLRATGLQGLKEQFLSSAQSSEKP